jgi:hypothetical protein
VSATSTENGSLQHHYCAALAVDFIDDGCISRGSGAAESPPCKAWSTHTRASKRLHISSTWVLSPGAAELKASPDAAVLCSYAAKEQVEPTWEPLVESNVER